MGYYNWPEILKGHSSLELAKIIRDHTESEEKVTSALNELKNRGLENASYSEIFEITNNSLKLEENSPTLYSKRVIYIFSVLFSVVFGAVLFAINQQEVDKKKSIFPVIIFSVLYTVFSYYILELMNAGSSATLLFSAIGALILNNIFWNKYIGKEIKYHKRSYKKPLIIALAIFIPLIALTIMSTILNN
jgi:hypothetical protein